MSGDEQPAGSGAAAPDERGGQTEPTIPGAPPAAGARPSRTGGAARVGSVLTSRAAGWVAAAALAGAIVAVAVTGLTSPSATGFGTPAAAQIAVRAPFGAAGPASIAPGRRQVRIIAPQAPVFLVPGRADVRVVPGGVLAAPFGQVAVGTVSSVSSSGCIITTGSGQKVTVVERPSTTYRKAGRPASASAVTRGATVAVLGSLTGSKITATVVAVLPAGTRFLPGTKG